MSRREELPLFDAAFDIYWAPPDPRVMAGQVPMRGRSLPLDPERAKAWLKVLGSPQSPLPRENEETPASSSGYSAQELLRVKNFDQMSWEESEQVRRLLAQSPWRLAERRTRRLAAARSGRVRPLVLICDVSGSMERYSRQLLIFAHAVARREDVETFVFSTRLTRITRLLRRRELDRALDAVSKQVHDFSGGTRIGEALHELNRKWARRVLGHGAVVIVVSDGWDRGDVGLLESELERLRRSAHRLIWLNPLLGSEGYEPVTRGMSAALPHVDDFLAAHNVVALDELGRHLAALDSRRSRR